MQDIYEALLITQESPNKATKMLYNLSHQQPRFLELLKDMALQLKDRFNPKDESTYAQFDKLAKQLLVIYNRFVKAAFEEGGNKIYLQIQDIYQWTLDILTCHKIPSNQKKIIEPAFTEIIRSLCFKKQYFLVFLDSITAHHMETSLSVFVYLNSMVSAQIYTSIKVQVLQQSYKTLYHIALCELTKMVEYYKQSYMDLDESNYRPNTEFLAILKQNQYILKSLCGCISYLYNLVVAEKSRFNHKRVMSDMLLDSDLALYLSRILKIQNEMFDMVKKEQNPFDLKIIIASNLNAHEKTIINKIKSMCLATLKLILKMTDKSFNLEHTGKILLKELPVIGQLIIQEIIICSYENVIPALDQQLSILGIISYLFDLLAEIALFKDMKPFFHKLSIEQLIRLTIAFMKTYHQEKDIFENQVEDYFVLVYYILSGKYNEDQQDDEIDLTLGDFCIKKNVIQLIKNMAIQIEGFNSILIEICCDYFLLEKKLKQTMNQEFKDMFLQKHRLKYSTLQCLSLQACIFTFTVSLKHYSNEIERKRTFRFFLDNVDPTSLSPLELCRFYVCLSFHCEQFIDNDIHCKYYHVIEHALSLVKNENSESRHAFFFLLQLTTANKWMFQSRNYCIFVDKILNDSLKAIEIAETVYLFGFLQNSISSQQVVDQIIPLSWINECLDRLNMLLRRQYQKRQLFHQLLAATFVLYDRLLTTGKVLLGKNREVRYPSFEKDEQEFNMLFNMALTQPVFDSFAKLLRDNALIQEEYQLLFKFTDFLFELLVSDIRLTESSSSLLTLYSIHLISRHQELDLEYNNISFRLLYQTINKTPYTLNQSHYQVILQWMRNSIQKEDRDQIYLNRACIILQEFYYFIKNNVFNGPEMIVFFTGITEAIEKKFLKYLLDFNQYLQMIQRESDPEIRKIELKNMEFNPKAAGKKKNPITIIRLYNTILMNPNFEPKSLHLIKGIIKNYIQETIPPYDLSVHFLALTHVISKSKNSGAIECFRLGLDLLYYNARHPKIQTSQTPAEKQIRNLTKDLRSPIACLDPYQQLHNLINNEIIKSRSNATFLDFSQNLEDLQVDVIDFIKSDQYTLDLVKKLTSIRKVNDQPRVIRKIKRDEI